MRNDKKAKLILTIFKYGKNWENKTGIFAKLNYALYKVLNAIFVIGMFNTEITPSQSISDKVILYHPYGIIINGKSNIADGVVIRQQVTIGNKGSGKGDELCPTIERNVEIGAGAKIIGKVTIGENSKIGANAVVTKSFPKNSIIVGVPAKNIAKNSHN